MTDGEHTNLVKALEVLGDAFEENFPGARGAAGSRAMRVAVDELVRMRVALCHIADDEHPESFTDPEDTIDHWSSMAKQALHRRD